MFGLRPTITSQHHGKDQSLAGDIKIPSNISTNHFPSSNTEHAFSTVKSEKQSSIDGIEAKKTPEVSTQNKIPMNLNTTAKKVTSFQSIPNSANVNKIPQSNGNKKN